MEEETLGWNMDMSVYLIIIHPLSNTVFKLHDSKIRDGMEMFHISQKPPLLVPPPDVPPAAS